ncbi:MAG TPA: hypothetical protein VM184_10500 [Gaiellaceae bacterium]|nr:hypothetical protein [Gaiellaceae bacterium]
MHAPESEQGKPKPPLPVIPLFLFAAVDLVLAFVLLMAGGFTLHFVLVAAIGIMLAAAGWFGLRMRPASEDRS